MPGYDFRSLNDKEFELLAADVIEAELSVRVERFKPGKDSGVDGRWFQAGGEAVMQAKHWVESGFAALLRRIENREAPKVASLAPARYVLVTSLPLSRANKNDLVAALGPYANVCDIYGAEDINAALARNPEIERRHFKLWLTSTSILQALVNNAIEGRSRAEVAEIAGEAHLYVVTSDYQAARTLLDSTRTLILTGEPGIGKTTLARQLVLEYTALGWELAAIEEDVSEAESLYQEGKRQLFYFDDFLGRTYLEAIRAKQDSHIVNFIKRIARDPQKRLILTSRTNIINQGARLSDLFGARSVEKSRYELTVAHLTRYDRAQILYSHIWHSPLSASYIDEIHAGRRYREVVSHRNFSPRLIGFLFDGDRSIDVPPTAFWSLVVDVLENPAEVWRHYFDAQLSQDDRDLAFLVVLNGARLEEAVLRDAFVRLKSDGIRDHGLVYHRFSVALRDTASAVLTRDLESATGRVTYRPFNPSVIDFVLNEFGRSNLWGPYFSALRTADCVAHLGRLRGGPLAAAEFDRILSKFSRSEGAPDALVDAFSWAIARLAASHNADGFVELARKLLPCNPPADVDAEDYVAVYLPFASVLDEHEFVEFTSRLLGEVDSKGLPDDPELVARVLSCLRDLGDYQDGRTIEAAVVASLREDLERIVVEDDVLGDYRPLDISQAREAVLACARGKLDEYGVSLVSDDLVRLCGVVDVEAILQENEERLWRNDDDPPSFRAVQPTSADEMAAIDDLFARD